MLLVSVLHMCHGHKVISLVAAHCKCNGCNKVKFRVFFLLFLFKEDSLLFFIQSLKILYKFFCPQVTSIYVHDDADDADVLLHLLPYIFLAHVVHLIFLSSHDVIFGEIHLCLLCFCLLVIYKNGAYGFLIPTVATRSSAVSTLSFKYSSLARAAFCS